MGEPRTPRPAKLLMSLIASQDDLLHQALEVLEGRYGEVDFKSDPIPFDVTDYYEEEMGKGLFRRFVTFAPLIRREELVRIKLETNEVERHFADPEGRRRVNIDPGYICAEHLILATTKGYTHRPYLGKGIYADLTMIFQDGEFRPLPWTYPDYASEPIRRLLGEIRRRYLKQLRETRS